MITTINEFKKINEENLLIPRRLEDRQLRLKQNNLRLLQQENIDRDLIIDSSYDFKKEQIKVKKINGNVILKDLDHIPEWLENLEINGYFKCWNTKLRSLKYCPQIIHGYFDCSDNFLKTLEHCPKIVYGSFNCARNWHRFSKEYVKELCNAKDVILYNII